MKKIFILIYTLLFASAFLTQLITFIVEHTSLIQYRVQHFPLIVFAIVTPIVALIELIVYSVPRLPVIRLTKILKADGYTPEFYKLVKRWHKKCCRRGFKTHANLFLAGVLIDGGHCTQAFEVLSAVNYDKLSLDQKRSFCNACLYAALISGDKKTADEVFRRSKGLLISSSGGEQTPSIHHTLGYYEYTCGNTKKAESLFNRSLEHASSADLICDNLLALSACYVDSGRLVPAKRAVEKAYDYALTAPLKAKLKRAMELVEGAAIGS